MTPLIEWAKEAMLEHGLWFLFLFSFTESLIQPIPVEPVLTAAVYWELSSPLDLLILVTSASLLGATLGYYLGKKWGHPAFLFVFRKRGKKWMKTGEELFEKYGAWVVFLSAFTPIPFKVAAWISGIFEMSFWKFFLAAILGRTLRFAVVIYGLEFLFGLWA